ncbi:MAG: diacylglycerol kinase [Lachnospiraceae bacterium]|nr:diacylglycerol kinase [Lachnospiraceae bacterium]
MNKDPLYKSFFYAYAGIFACIKNERNMRIHCAFMIAVIMAGIFFEISVLEWVICFMLFAMVESLELVNTAIEATVDLVTEDRKPLAKLAKDAAAGAVLIAAMAAAVIGLIIFIPKGIAFLSI